MKLFGLEFTRAGTIDRLKENFADIQRQFEDIGWMSFSSLGGFGNLFKDNYKDIVTRSRKAYHKNPLVGHAIQLTTDYVFGEGLTLPKAGTSDDANPHNDEVQDITDKFWLDPDNQISLTSAMAQRALSNKLQYDGEINFRLFVDDDGSVFVRILDPLSTVTVHAPQDNMRVDFWATWQGTTKKYIPDVSNALAFLREEKPDEWEDMLKAHGIKDINVLKNQYVYHVQINADINDDRGVPLPWRALDWVNDHARLHSDMSSFIHAQAQYAWKKKVKGSKAQIQAMRARGQQTTRLTVPAYQAGSTIIENDAVDNKPIDLKAGSGQLFTEGIRQVFRMITIAFGLFEHYFGDLGNANLATAKSVELPMLKKFRALQKVWEDTIKFILNFQLDMEIMAYNRNAFEYIESRNRLELIESKDFKLGRFIDLDFPPILQQDIKELADGWSLAKKEGLAPIDTARKEFLVGAGINNIEEEMQKEYQGPAAPVNPFGALPPEDEDAEAKEAAGGDTRPKDFTTRREKALKLADKNKVVLSKMNEYIKEIGVEYRKMKSAIRGAAKAKETGVKIKGLRSKLNTFKEKMDKLARKNFPVATEIGAQYVSSRIDITEVKEAFKADKFTEEQIRQNAEYLEGLADDMYTKLSLLSEATYKTAEMADEALVDAINSYEKRIGSYAGFFWTVEERAVQEAGKASPDTEAIFVGVEDDDNCPGCAAGIAGNPWKMSDIPIPGEQECMTNCRHAIQISGDEELTESDRQLLRDEETRARDGYILEANRIGYKEKITETKGCGCCTHDKV